MIEVSHLVKKYGDHPAVNDLSFVMEKGMIYGFLGANGAGKSTTMNIMTGYLAATEGEVRIEGFNVLKEPEKAKKAIGYLPEQPPVYPEMTVREYLMFAAGLKQIPRKEQKAEVHRVMEKTATAEVAGRLIQNLSKGYRQRVGLAQAILGNPPVIILDEPTVGLDPKQILEIRELILSLREEHIVLLSSHILSEVAAVCDKIFILSKGRLVASDSTENLVTRLETKDGAGGRLELWLKGTAERAKEVLSLMAEVSVVEAADKGRGECRLILEWRGKEDIREKLFYLLADKKLPMMKLSGESRSLEEVFLELTEGEVTENEGNV
ncbi:MAG: ABC transporter ATP-binding protein [Lachnospiraceae bacterium]|nr:ABC transporter ATP-binding protein [Lachnospiraceae bacterium]